ncbi:hypothetical protein QJQ45_020819 [Haematococcus lacustris]|nr:hypothetical protein QJQ45_020819 [Haematococcus lacustris]
MSLTLAPPKGQPPKGTFKGQHGGMAAQCPPTVMLQCPGSLTSSSCQQLRRQLFTAAGLDPDTGQYANCLKAGKADWVQVLVGSQAVAVSRPALLAVLQQGLAAPVAQLTIPTPLNFTQASMQVFVDQAIASWGNPEYVSPNDNDHGGSDGDGGDGVACAGTTEITVPPFTYDQPHNMVSTLRFLDDYILFSPWKVVRSAAGTTLTSSPLADNITLSVVTEIKVWVGMVALAACQAWMIDKEKGLQLTYQEVYRGSLVDLVPDTPRQLVAVTVYDTAAPEYITLPAYGGMWCVWASLCLLHCWHSARPVMFVTWTAHQARQKYPQHKEGGDYAELRMDLGLDCTPWDPISMVDLQPLELISMVDLQPLTLPCQLLPRYLGRLRRYIWANFGMAAIWLFGLGLLILIAPVLIWWNVRDNRGLPPITYRYMKRFRGW